MQTEQEHDSHRTPGHASVCAGLFDVVDDEFRSRLFTRLQSQSERTDRPIENHIWARGHRIGNLFQWEVVAPGEPRLIADRTSGYAQEPCEIAHGRPIE